MRKIYILLLLLLVLLSIHTFGQINTPSGAAHPFNSNTSYAFGIMPTNLPTSGTFLKSQDAADAYNTWKTNYVRACGSQYRVLFDDGSSTVSEGIGYGMLLAAYAADKALLDGLWAYYKANANGNGLMNWKIGGCSGVSGSGGATDADEDAAMALLVAKCQWPSATSPYNYNTEATNLITAIGNKEVVSGSGQVINGDGWGTTNTCRNPSYFAPAYYRLFAGQVSGQSSLWNNAANASYTLLNANVNSSTGLVSNWSDNNGITNACNGGNSGWYSYDACRNPWRMATDYIWNGTSAAQSNFCNKIAAYCQSKGATSVGGDIAQSGGTGSHNPTFISTFAAGICGASSSNQTILNQMYSETVAKSDNPPLYFGNTLRCIGLFVMTGNFWKPCGAAVTCTAPGATITAGGATTFCAGGNVVLNANTGTGLTYQWKNGGTAIGGATGSSYTATASGTYTVDVTSGTCTSTSSGTTVTVNAVPAVPTISAGGATTFCTGGNLVLSTAATGVTYQWKSGGTNIGGATNSSYTATTAGSYTVTVTSSGCSSTSAATTVTVNAVPTTPTITGTASFCTGGNTVLSTNATGVTYQWNNGGSAIGGATNTSYTATAAGSYTVTVTSSGCSSTSAATTVTVNTVPSTPSITAAGATTFCSGANVVLSTSATGVTYQWKNGGTNIAGATNASYTATASGSYTVTVTSSGCSSTSGATSVAVNTGPATPAITAGGPTTFCSGGNVVLSTNATGVTYQWNSGGTAIAGATNASYTATAAGSYTVTVTASGCPSTSAATAVTVNSVNSPPAITSSGATTFCSGGNVVLSTSATGVTYQWNNGGTAIGGATNASYTATASGSYSVTITSSGCSSTSTATTVTVNAVPAAPSITASGPTTFCSGGNVVLSTGATGVTYQWNNGGASIAGATGNSYNATATGFYTVTVTSSGCSGTSAATTVTANPVPATPGITAGGPTTFCTGGNVVLSTAASGVTYQWKNGATNIAGATASSYTATAAGSYTVTVTSSGCSSTSATTTTTVNSSIAASVSITSDASSICSGTAVNFTATPASGVPSPGYQWKKNGNNIGGATSAAYSASGVLNGDVFTCVMTSSGSCVTGSPATSNSIIVSVSGQPTVANAGPDQFTTTTSAVLAANTPASGSGAWTLVNGSGSIANSTNPSSAVTGLSSGANTFRWTISSNPCSPSSDDVIINVGSTPDVSVVTGPTSVTGGEIYTYTVPLDPSATYTWTVPPGATIISGQGTNTITVTFGSTSGNVSVTATNSYGTATGTTSVTVVTTAISSGYASDPSSVYPNPFSNDVTIRINSAGTLEVTLKVTDLKGTEVYASSAYYTNEDIKLGSELRSGMYIVRASYGNKMSLIKLTKIEE
jgi:endo-1,4-beta-D-glucanase Y